MNEHKGQIVGYARVSSEDQNPDRQLEGVTLDEKFVEKASGKSLDRPVLQQMLQYVRKGDTVIVHSFDRLGRDEADLKYLISFLTDKGVKVQFLKEGFTFTGEDTPVAKMMLSFLAAMSEFVRARIKESQMEGILLAQKRGAYKGRKKKLTDTQLAEIETLLKGGMTKTNIAKQCNICRGTLYKGLRQIKERAQNAT